MMNCSPLFLFSTVFIRNTLFLQLFSNKKKRKPYPNKRKFLQRNRNYAKKQKAEKCNHLKKMQPPSQKCNHPPKNATAKASCFVALFSFVYFPFIWFKRNGSIFSRFLVCCFPLFYVLLQNKKRNDFVSIVAFRCGKSLYK